MGHSPGASESTESEAGLDRKVSVACSGVVMVEISGYLGNGSV
jgi:hypothetical protein